MSPDDSGLRRCFKYICLIFLTAGDAARSIYSGVRVYACACGAHEAEGPMAHEGEVLR